MAYRPVKIDLIYRCYADRLRAHPHSDHRPARWRRLPGMSGLPSNLRGRRPRSREGRGRRRVAAPAFVLLCFVFFAGRDDSSATKSEGRKRMAQCASTGNRAQDVSPGTGRKNPGPRASFAPFRGWQIGDPKPRAVRPGLVSFALTGSVRSMPFAACRNAGRAILPGNRARRLNSLPHSRWDTVTSLPLLPSEPRVERRCAGRPSR